MTALAWRMERPEWVPPPALTTSVSPSVILTLSNGTPSRSAVTCAKLVSCPWPAGCVPITTSTAVPMNDQVGPLLGRADGGLDVIGEAQP